jgi:hypothetical protein
MKILALMAAMLVCGACAQSQTIALQQGINGYQGCTDRELRNPETNYFAGPKDDSLLVSEH